jgi:two-component system NarL family sensor kinase
VLRLIEADDLAGRRDYATAEARGTLARALAAFEIPAAHARRCGGERTPVLRNPWLGCAALVMIRGGAEEDVSALLLIGPKRGGGPLRGKDHDVLATIAHQAATALDNALLIGGLHTTMTQLIRSTEQLEAARAEQRLLLREVVDADERQRAALARELHDDALQDVLYLSRHSRYCASLVSALGAPESGAHQTDRLREELGHLAHAATDAERKLRDLCAGLYPALLESLGLVAALESLAEDLGAAEGTTIAIHCDDAATGRVTEWDSATQLHLYRIAQEAVRNATRHASGQQMTIRLALAPPARRASAPALPGAPSQVQLTIDDDGRCMRLPVDYAALLRAGHLGLASMRERASRIGADLTLSRNERGGLCVRVTIPLAVPAAALAPATFKTEPRAIVRDAPASAPIGAAPARGVD